MRWAVTVSVFGLLAASMPIAAGDAAAETLKEAVEASIGFHPEIRRDQALSVAADQAVEQAFSGFLPALEFDVSHGVEVTTSPTTRGAGIGKRSMNRTDSRGTISQLLFDFFQTSNTVASAKSELQASNADLQATAERVAREAIDEYILVVEARRQVELAEGNVADHVAIVDLIRGRVAAGRSAEADLDQAVSRLALVRSNLVALQGREAQATSRYIETVGFEPGDLDMPEEPDYPEATDLDAALATAMDRNPLGHSTAASWDARKAEIEVAKAEYYPRFDIEATGGAANDVDGVSGFRGDVGVLLRMRWNLFSGFGDLARTRAASQEANAASRDDAEVRRLIREETRIAFKLLQTSKDRLPPLRADVAASRETFQAYREQFDLGQRTLLDLLDARDEQFDADQDLVTGEMDVLRSHYNLLFATGLLMDSFGLVIFEEDLEYQERGRGVNLQEVNAEPATSEDLASAPTPQADEPRIAVAKAVAEEAEPLSDAKINWNAETGLPGASEFGFWLGGNIQRQMTPVAEDEAEFLSTAVAQPAVDPSAARREIAGIEVESIPVMAAVPETEVEVLPNVALGGVAEPVDDTAGEAVPLEPAAGGIRSTVIEFVGAEPSADEDMAAPVETAPVAAAEEAPVKIPEFGAASR